MIQEGENGILIPPDDPQAILSALLPLLSDPALRLQFGVNGRNLIEKKYSLSAVAEKLNEVYRKFASQQKRR